MSRNNDRMKMMAELPVPSVLVKMSLPMMISFFIQALYNIVDSMFVARISENALTAVSLAFPMQQIVTALAVGTATGVSAVWARKMGMGDKEGASSVIQTMTGISLIFTVVFILLGLFASEPIFRVQTNVEEIAVYGTTYLSINWLFSCGSIFSKYYERLLVSSGQATLSMIAMASGAVFNLVFDPLLIFGIGFFPEMGIAGAAIATIGGQIFSAIIALILNIRYNPSVRKDLFRFGFKVQAAIDIFRVGLPSIITMGLSSVTSFFINQILLAYSTTATAVYGIWMKLQNFCYMPIFGLNNGVVPVLSYNYGIGNKDRVKETMKLSVGAGAVLMLLLVVILELVPNGILTLFSASDYMRSVGIHCLRICVFTLPFGAVSMLRGTSMQALDHARYALLINLMRQCVLLIGSFALISAIFHDQNVIWYAVLITEVITFIVCCILNRKFVRNLQL